MASLAKSMGEYVTGRAHPTESCVTRGAGSFMRDLSISPEPGPSSPAVLATRDNAAAVPRGSGCCVSLG